MDLDLEEYDQVEEIRFMVEDGNGVGQVYCNSSAAANGNFVVSLSSCSDQASLDDSDFIFIPDLVKRSTDEPQACKPAASLPTATLAAAAAVAVASKASTRQADTKLRYHQSANQLLESQLSSTSKLFEHQQVVHPVATRHNSSHNGNPFQRCLALDSCQQTISAEILQLEMQTRRIETPDKPVGPLGCSTRSPTDPSKLTCLMQQIVTRSDSILIVIPCSYCNQSISCQPSDVSSWLRHMDSQHNSRVCPICAKLVGLGYTRDINIMKRHVLEHIDDRWLSNQPTKTNFTFGLQQQWFSEIGCAVRDLRNK